MGNPCVDFRLLVDGQEKTRTRCDFNQDKNDANNDGILIWQEPNLSSGKHTVWVECKAHPLNGEPVISRFYAGNKGIHRLLFAQIVD
jgi:hypothetical protein